MLTELIRGVERYQNVEGPIPDWGRAKCSPYKERGGGGWVWCRCWGGWPVGVVYLLGLVGMM